MTILENKFRKELDAYQYNKELSDAQVNRFFDKYDKEKSTKSGFPIFLKIAASITFLLGVAWGSWSIADVEVMTDLAETREVRLPDESKVILNAASTLQYNRIAWLLHRSLNLEGEAFFEVTKGENFAVISSRGTTEVLGTTFNIVARGDIYEVSCFTGKVRVSSSESKVVLERGDRAVSVANKNLVKTSFDSLANTWRQGEYHYDNAKLSVIIKDLELAFGVAIRAEGTNLDKRYSGYFPSSDISMALKLVFEPLGYTYEINDEQVTIKMNTN